MSDKLVAVVGGGLFGPILDKPVDMREPRKLTDWQFDMMVRDLYYRGRVAVDAIENRYLH